jgi:hypothetical protein
VVAFVGAGLAIVLMRRRDILQSQPVAAEGQP